MELEKINNKIEKITRQVSDQKDGAFTEEEIVPLISYKREITAIPSWPFDVSAITRLGFYLVIPPLTWMGIALMEKMLDLFI